MNRTGKAFIVMGVVLLVARLAQFAMMGYFVVDLPDAVPVCKYSFSMISNVNALLYDLTGQGGTLPAPWALVLMTGTILLLGSRHEPSSG